MSKQPRDDGNDPIPVLGFRTHSDIKFRLLPQHLTPLLQFQSVRVVTLYSTAECFVETHISDSIEANKVNSHLFATVPYDISLGHETNAADNDDLLR